LHGRRLEAIRRSAYLGEKRDGEPLGALVLKRLLQQSPR
jgi:hypothetical protein